MIKILLSNTSHKEKDSSNTKSPDLPSVGPSIPQNYSLLSQLLHPNFLEWDILKISIKYGYFYFYNIKTHILLLWEK